MLIRSLSIAIITAGIGTSLAEAALFTGPATFSTAPWSQMGSVTNSLVINNTANGFVVSGQAIIAVTPGSSGILVEWIVDRPLDPLYAGPFNLQTTTILDGFSAPPVGTFSSTAGVARTEFTSHPGSLSNIPLSLVNGLDIPPWTPQITVTSPTFVYTPGPGLVLRQHFFVDGVYISGPGGNWVIDVPLWSSFAPDPATIPEPSSVVLVAGAALCCAAGARLRGRLRRSLVSADRKLSV
jgi:hypothetical protein